MPMEDNPLARWIIERKSLEADLVRLQITLAQCAGHITLEQMDRLGVSIDPPASPRKVAQCRDFASGSKDIKGETLRMGSSYHT